MSEISTAMSSNLSLPQTPRGLHHVAFVTQDAVATVDFYTGVLRMPLIATVINAEIAVTNEPYPYLHLFFRMSDGSCVAFFEAPDLPPPSPASDSAYNIFNHLALNVGSRDEVDLWAQHFKNEGVEFILKDHGIIYSIYVHDPSGHRVELTCSVTDDWQKLGDAAKEDMRQWEAIKKQAKGDTQVLRNWLIDHEKYPGQRGQ